MKRNLPIACIAVVALATIWSSDILLQQKPPLPNPTTTPSATALFPPNALLYDTECPVLSPAISSIDYRNVSIPTDASLQDKLRYLDEMNRLRSRLSGYNLVDTHAEGHSDFIFLHDFCWSLKLAPPYLALQHIQQAEARMEYGWLDATELYALPAERLRPIARTQKRHFVLLTRALPPTPWKFVTDGKVYGWTKTEVAPLAATDAPINTHSTNDEFVEFDAWLQQRKRQETLITLQHAVERGDVQDIARLRSVHCPHDFTKREKDGIVMSSLYPASEYSTEERVALAQACGEKRPSRPLKKVTMTASQCLCLTGMGADETEMILTPQTFPHYPTCRSCVEHGTDSASKGYTHYQSCDLLQYHVECYDEVRGQDDSWTVTYCPLSCMHYE